MSKWLQKSTQQCPPSAVIGESQLRLETDTMTHMYRNKRTLVLEKAKNCRVAKWCCCSGNSLVVSCRLK